MASVGVGVGKVVTRVLELGRCQAYTLRSAHAPLSPCPLPLSWTWNFDRRGERRTWGSGDLGALTTCSLLAGALGRWDARGRGNSEYAKPVMSVHIRRPHSRCGRCGGSSHRLLLVACFFIAAGLLRRCGLSSSWAAALLG